MRESRQILFYMMVMLFAFQAGRTGLPTLKIFHTQSDNHVHCNCGCDCDDHPSSQDSCLNPKNIYSIQCGCTQAHHVEIVLPAPPLLDLLSPESLTVLPPPRWVETGFQEPHCVLPREMRDPLQKPH